MDMIKLDAIDSTNSFLKKLSGEKELNDYTVVLAEYQSGGRGQMGTSWKSEPGKNLTCSIYKKVLCVDRTAQFYLNIAVSLAVYDVLQSLTIPQLKIKWPNDILSANQKICGILIENVIKQGQLYNTIIGIGLNVNQTDFSGLLNATSLKLLTGRSYDLDELVQRIIQKLQIYEKYIIEKIFKELSQTYEACLFRKDKPSTFKDAKGQLFMGYIKGISNDGRLKVLLEDEVMKEFELKEVKLLY
ncbi:biotin--[acetyl-CoA-carboxylase] ligase [Leptobacterium sp. I13]|uniref:biotin--[acetyl-CoA-carboxylase] ligase n=1 Tax=Leptobacterium meishanense TaxID=3128904 RepID=UPI0030ECF7AB